VLLETFGGGNDWISWFYDYNTYCDYDLFNDINGLDMNDWDKVEKRKRVATDQDIFFENVKSACFIIVGVVYLYFLFIHKG
jgi:hypothetical protein|tara:strand:+ start:25 stop:267 length:243 start_codon:yes stop_codon:yes gene_type:complete